MGFLFHLKNKLLLKEMTHLPNELVIEIYEKCDIEDICKALVLFPF